MRLEDVAASPHFREEAELASPAVVSPPEAIVSELEGSSVASLSEMVEDPQCSLAQRLAAGAMMAVLGDPRPASADAVCAVPGGSVTIGLPKREVDEVVSAWRHVGVDREWIDKETPEHRVDVADYWIARYPVTNQSWWDFLCATGHATRPSTWYLGAYPWDRSNHPVAGVSVSDAEAFTVWWSERTGHRWRLPTEAEWEYAAKGPAGYAYPWGETFDPAHANTREAGIHTTSPVGAFPSGRSSFGLFDMAGNVEEYVSEDYQPYPDGPYVADHLVQTRGAYRVARGGSFARFGDLTRTRRRHGAFPSPLYPVGLRLATSDRPPNPAEESDHVR